MEEKEVKIIWHFRTNHLSPEEMERFSDKIKEFHKESIVVFSEELEITIID